MTNLFSSKLMLIAAILFSAKTFSQNAGINSTGATPDASTILDLNTGNNFASPGGKGLLIPNVSLTTTADVTTVASPVNSLIVYNTNAGITGTGAAGTGYYYYSTAASRWINLIDNLAPGGAWMVNGNSGNTNPAVPATYGTSTIGASENFLGNTDAIDLVFGTSNLERMRIDKTTGHVVIGSATPSVGRKLYVSTSTASANGAAIWGDATSTTTLCYGVFGSIGSTANLSAAVRGYSGATTVATGNNAGVWGENFCANGYGVAGLNTSTYNIGGPYSYTGVYASKQGAAVTGTGYGVYSTATGTATTNYGGFITASGATTNVGGYFSGSAGTNNYAIVVPNTGGNVGIGTTTPDVNASLDIETTGRRILGLFGNGNIVTATDNATQAGIVVSAQWSPTTSTTDVVGIDPYVNLAPGAGVTITNAYGLRVRGSKIGAGTVTNGYGVYVDMNPGFGTNKYAAAFLNGNVGIGCASPQYPLHVVGNMGVAGTIFATAASVTAGVLACSDIRYKKNVSALSNSLNKILQLRGVNYFWRSSDFPEKKFTEDKQIGFIAQELEKIYPEVVFTDKDGYKSVDYSRLTPALVEAIKEQQSIIDEQKQELEKQNERITKLEELMNVAKK